MLPAFLLGVMVALPFQMLEIDTATEVLCVKAHELISDINSNVLGELPVFDAPLKQTSLFVLHDDQELPFLDTNALFSGRLEEFYQISTNWLFPLKMGGVTWVRCDGGVNKVHMCLARVMRYLARTQDHISYFAYTKSDLHLSAGALQKIDRNSVVTLPDYHCTPIKNFSGLHPFAPVGGAYVESLEKANVKDLCQGWTDFFFIPRSLWLSFGKWSRALENVDLSSEVIIATILNLIASEHGVKMTTLACEGDALTKANAISEINVPECAKGYFSKVKAD
jgi:hypothetical protein